MGYRGVVLIAVCERKQEAAARNVNLASCASEYSDSSRVSCFEV